MADTVEITVSTVNGHQRDIEMYHPGVWEATKIGKMAPDKPNEQIDQTRDFIGYVLDNATDANASLADVLDMKSISKIVNTLKNILENGQSMSTDDFQVESKARVFHEDDFDENGYVDLSEWR